MRKTIPAIAVLALVFALAVQSALAAPHITDFSLGITREETLLRAAAPCGDNLCGEVSFGGKNWGGTFLFKDDTLYAISLFGPLDDAYVEAAFAGFAESPYVVCRALTDDACFDFARKAAEGLSPEQLDAAFKEFLRGIGNTAHTFASYFYTEPAVYAALKQASLSAGTAASRKKTPAGQFPASAERKAHAPARSAEPDQSAAEAPPARADLCAENTPAASEPAMAETPKAALAEDSAPSSGPSTGEVSAPGDASASSGQTLPEKNTIPDGVTCMLTIDEDGVTIIIMSRSDLQRELTRRGARAAVQPAKKPVSAVSAPPSPEGKR